MAKITVTVAIPSNKLSPHAKGHWRSKSVPTKASRAAAVIASLNAMGDQGFNRPPLWKKARLHIKAYFPTACRWDQLNFIGACKAAIDGCADAGIVVNDNGVSMGSVDTSLIDKANPRVELTFVEEA